jgi:hypothetical protein
MFYTHLIHPQCLYNSAISRAAPAFKAGFCNRRNEMEPALVVILLDLRKTPRLDSWQVFRTGFSAGARILLQVKEKENPLITVYTQ